jgi:hypothetical protein
MQGIVRGWVGCQASRSCQSFMAEEMMVPVRAGEPEEEDAMASERRWSMRTMRFKRPSLTPIM